YRELIRTAWTTAYDSGVFARAYAMIEADLTQYSKAFSRNYKRWNNLIDNSAFHSELSYRAAMCTTQEEAAAFLLEWLQSRVEFLNEEWHS
ncbi:MAG: spore coat protein CotH, partial [Lachnospiraceae bacterium]|nr:spore coat protein CotH [Lachnospiraceae bacterium]